MMNEVIKWKHFPHYWSFVRWIPLTKASDAEIWFFFYLCRNKQFSKQHWGWWFETPSRSLWRNSQILLPLELTPMRGSFHPRALRWRHNGRDSVSNHQPHDSFLKRLFRRRSKKTSKLCDTGLCAGNHRRPVNSPHKWPVTRKLFPFDDVIMENLIESPRTPHHAHASCGHFY